MDAIKDLPPSTDPDLLVGFETSDDAAVYRVSPELAVISTVDFITPPVDDPYWFGQIAAANSLSDVYAMGGKPLMALNVVMYPVSKLEPAILKEIFQGGHDKVIEAGASMAGGHSVDDNEPKYGLSVTGVVHPDRILTNCGAKEGDALVLTKSVGTGVLFNACRSGKLPWSEIEVLLPQIASLSGQALEIALKFDIHACTDVTGFGIVGHALEMSLGCGTSIDLQYKNLPIYPNAIQMYRSGETTGSNMENRKLSVNELEIKADLSSEEEELLFDPQTSGGLLLALPPEDAERLIEELQEAGISSASRVGEVRAGRQPGIRVI